MWTNTETSGPSPRRRAEHRLLALGLVAWLLLPACTSGRGGDSPPEEAAPVSAEQSARPGGDDTFQGPPPPYKPHKLDGFFRALLKAEDDEQRRRISVLHVGDSHTASDTITGRIREHLQRRFGDGGRGLAHPGRPWRTFRQEQMDYDMSRHWKTYLGMREDDPGPFAMNGVRVETSKEGAWLERSTCKRCRNGDTFDRFSIHYLVQPKGGSFTVSVDEEPATVIETDGEQRRFGVYRSSIEPGPHTIRVEAAGDGPIALFGLRTQLGDDGIEYHTLGINGATAPQFASFDRDLTKEQIRRLDPDLMIFAFGTNEAYNFYRMERSDRYGYEALTQALANYQVEFDRLLERYQSAAPRAGCLVILPPDLAPKRDDLPCRRREQAGGREVCLQQPPHTFMGVVADQRHAARRAGCAVWDQTAAMGGTGTMAIWSALEPPLARSDGIHLTMAGYNLLADSVYNDLIRTYEIWKRGGHIRLPTTPIQPRAVAGAFGP